MTDELKEAIQTINAMHMGEMTDKQIDAIQVLIRHATPQLQPIEAGEKKYGEGVQDGYKEGLSVGKGIGEGTRLKLMDTIICGLEAEIKNLKAELALGSALRPGEENWEIEFDEKFKDGEIDPNGHFSDSPFGRDDIKSFIRSLLSTPKVEVPSIETTRPSGASAEWERVDTAIQDMLGGHYNLYKQSFGEDSNPEDDICRKQLKEVIPFIRSLLAGRGK